MSETKRDADGSSRREFLKLAATGAPVAAAVAVVGGGEAEAAQAPATSLGLKKTEHVQKYLDSARF